MPIIQDWVSGFFIAIPCDQGIACDQTRDSRKHLNEIVDVQIVKPCVRTIIVK